VDDTIRSPSFWGFSPQNDMEERKRQSQCSSIFRKYMASGVDKIITDPISWPWTSNDTGTAMRHFYINNCWQWNSYRDDLLSINTAITSYPTLLSWHLWCLALLWECRRVPQHLKISVMFSVVCAVLPGVTVYSLRRLALASRHSHLGGSRPFCHYHSFWTSVVYICMHCGSQASHQLPEDFDDFDIPGPNGMMEGRVLRCRQHGYRNPHSIITVHFRSTQFLQRVQCNLCYLYFRYLLRRRRDVLWCLPVNNGVLSGAYQLVR
jgi:DNA-directed RNA polymerase subunit RPC12/RpoP